MDIHPGVEGGTWLAMNMKTGDIGVLLNIKEPKPLVKPKKSRGFLVVDYLKLKNRIKKVNYLKKLKKNSDKYNGFNFITIDRDESKNYSLSLFSNRSNCLMLNQLKTSFVFTNSMRPDYPFYRGLIFKREFDKLLRAINIINDLKHINDLNKSDSLFHNLNNDQANQKSTAQINDSFDNHKFRLAKLTTNPKKEFGNFSDGTYSDKTNSNKHCIEITSKKNLKCYCNIYNEENRKKNLNLDYRKFENQELLTKDLLNVMLSPQNFYKQEKQGNYFQKQNCLSNESIKRAISSLCISLPEHNYGSRTFTIILVDSDHRASFFEWTRDCVNDKNININLNRRFQFDLN